MLILRLVYFIFIGWWLGFVFVALGLILCATIIGLPFGVLLLAKSKQAFWL
jgi:uncharacterized membrane protein YccF (DUF307 family)